jgi:hypothetical protein
MDWGMYKTRELKIYESRREEVKETGEKCIIGSFIISTPG